MRTKVLTLTLLLTVVSLVCAKRCPKLSVSPAQELLPGTDPKLERLFCGQYVKVQGRNAAVGCYGADSYRGSTNMYKLNADGKWEFKQELVLPNRGRGDYAGLSVGLWKNKFIMGAPYDKPNGSRSGSAHIYELVGGNWTHSFELIPPNGMSQARFGYAVDIQGNIVVVGARYQDNGETGKARTGAVYIYERHSRTDYRLIQTFYGNETNSHFADEVRIWGVDPAGQQRILVGSPRAKDGRARKGRAYLYEKNAKTGSFEFVQDFLPDDSAVQENPNAHYGEMISLTENTAIVGGEHAPSPANIKSGAAYVYKLQKDGKFSQVAPLYPGRRGGGRFAQRGAQRGPIALISAWNRGGPNGPAGAAYVYGECDDGSWELIGDIALKDSEGNEIGQRGDEFGKMAFMSYHWFMFGAPKRDTGDDGKSKRGGAYMYKYSYKMEKFEESA